MREAIKKLQGRGVETSHTSMDDKRISDEANQEKRTYDRDKGPKRGYNISL